MRSFFTISIVSVFIAPLFLGCGSSGSPTGKVVGQVQFKHQPIPVGLVTFHSNERGIAATTKIQDGKFALETPLETGTYFVYVSPPLPEPRDPSLGPPPPAPTVNIPPKAQDPQTSGLTVSVAPGENEVTLELVE